MESPQKRQTLKKGVCFFINTKVISYTCLMSNIHFDEYGKAIQGCFRNETPKCPMVAVIPTLVVDNIEGLKGLADCLVHVDNINTTFYIDDKHRVTITWAGPVEFDGYDYTTNPLRLRSQICYDFNNNRAIYFNKTGEYKIIELTSGE